jgi:hypothetical protein
MLLLTQVKLSLDLAQTAQQLETKIEGMSKTVADLF